MRSSPHRRPDECCSQRPVEKSRELWGEAAVEKATEQLCRRFDIFLQRCYHERNDAQRGLIVFSEGRFDARAKLWVRLHGEYPIGTSTMRAPRASRRAVIS